MVSRRGPVERCKAASKGASTYSAESSNDLDTNWTFILLLIAIGVLMALHFFKVAPALPALR
ncbi:MAG: hypothetical protein ACI8QT_002258 [Halioglobus sp.]|jgi:hypothetical protein